MITFGTKAETLKALETTLKQARILPQVTFSVADWKRDKASVLSAVFSDLGKSPLIVRSSAKDEDLLQKSNAGKYDSILGVQGEENFEIAVGTIMKSFTSEEDQILVQPMLQGVVMCGVAFTLDLTTMGNYYVIDYDDVTGTTNSITSGNGKNNKLCYIWKGNVSEDIYKDNPRIGKLLRTLQNLEALFGIDYLDVEFAFDQQENLYIFQVRPLCLQGERIDLNIQKGALNQISQKIKNENRPKPFLLGKRTIYGIMPDWNPAEIIGIRPKNLAMSLYKQIVTDSTWAYQRNNYGYKNMRSFPLMQNFCGLPYIDVRVSFNSFIPAMLEESIGEKLVNYYLDRLQERPDFHDKIEFEIVFSCYTLDLEDRISKLIHYGFTKEEIKKIIDALRIMTCKIIDNEEGLWKKDYQKIEILEERFEVIQKSSLSKIDKIYWLLEDCRRYGTLPFAGLARAGFIAVQLLKSMITKGILSEEEYQVFMGGLNTVNYTMKNDLMELSKTAFLKKYGHLRPGTYDITSKRYDDAPDIYFDWKQSKPEEPDRKEFKLSLLQIQHLKDMLKEKGLPEDVLAIFNFIRTAIEGREFAKFMFTKNLSQALELFAEIGQENGFSKEECAYADINIISDLFSSVGTIKKLYQDSIDTGKEKYHITKYLTLPPLIFSEKDIFGFSYMDSQPNYITHKTVIGNVSILKEQFEKCEIKDKIVLIPSADPGYDWIFSHNIKGFITLYGGANSHMAIRANELQIPAVIGVGEKLYQQLLKARTVEIDTQSKKVNLFK